MPSKRKTTGSTTTNPRARTKSLQEPKYPSLNGSLAPADRLAVLLKEAATRGVKPKNDDAYDRDLDQFRDMWGGDAEIDAMVAWLHTVRREGLSG
jgi:hypothetical protein